MIYSICVLFMRILLLCYTKLNYIQYNTIYTIYIGERVSDDIVEGDNTCYGFTDDSQCCKEGFYATQGWLVYCVCMLIV